MSVRYCLSAYVSPTGVAGLFWPRHDQCVALWRVSTGSVTLVRYWELERISGLKHHVWPVLTPERREALFEELLREEGLTLTEIDQIWGLPDVGDSSAIVDLAAQNSLSVHSLGHLFGCILLDSKEFRTQTIIALAIDGGPDFVLEERVPTHWYSGAIVVDGQLHFRPVQSPGLLYTAATMVFAAEPGTLRASTSVCGCRADLDALSDEKLSTATFYGGHDGGWKTAVALVTAAANEAKALLDERIIGQCDENRIAPEEHVRTVVMRRVQQIAEEIAVANVRFLASEFGIDTRTAYLGVSGGSALNCPTNSRLLSEFEFRGLRCPPCANDGGQALGLGLAGLYTEGILPGANFSFDGPYLGPTETDLPAAQKRYAEWIADIEPFEDCRFVEDVQAGPVGWVDSASEIGPRALGHRSLLADPRTISSKDALNALKQRQWWRPVAPIVLESEVADWFDCGHRSPYMLEVFTIPEEQRSRIPAVAHLDGTARVQTLSHNDDPRLHAALSAFFDHTGVPVLCNTSLNAKGEPIIQTATQAIEFCLRTGVSVLYVDGARIQLRTEIDAPTDFPAVPGPRRGELFSGEEDARRLLWGDLEKKGIGVDVIALIARAPQLSSALESSAVLRKLQALADRTRHDDSAWGTYVDHLHAAYGPEGSFEGMFSQKNSEDALLPKVGELLQTEEPALGRQD